MQNIVVSVIKVLPGNSKDQASSLNANHENVSVAQPVKLYNRFQKNFAHLDCSESTTACR